MPKVDCPKMSTSHPSSGLSSKGVTVQDKKNAALSAITLILALALFLALAICTAYGLNYGDVNQSAAKGSITIMANESPIATIHVNEDMSATVDYLSHRITGTLKLEGAEEDTLLFQLRDASLIDEPLTDDAILFIRMPRSGLQGNYEGFWVIYYSCPSENIMRSDWLYASSNNNALAGFSNKTNAITKQRNVLLENAEPYRWEKRGSVLLLSN